MLAIQTKYLGPTNFRGSRIKACVMEQRSALNPHGMRSHTGHYDDALASDDNHKAAARALIAQLGWTEANGYGPWIVGSCPRGYVFTCDTRHGGDRLHV